MRDIESIIPEVKMWRDAKSISYSPLNGGFVNCTYKVDVDGNSYVLRINGSQNSFLNLRREDEVEVVRKVNELGFAPKVYIVENKSDYLITEFINGSIIKRPEIHDPTIIKKVAMMLTKVHEITGVSRECSPFFLIQKYLEGAKLLNVVIPSDLEILLKKVDEIENRSSKYGAIITKYCHNDYYTFNIIKKDESLFVIDWELSGVGNIFFDLATISFSNAFSKEEDDILLKQYFGFIEDEHKTLLYDMKYMNMLREATWALLHSGMEIKKINHNINYYNVALLHIERLKNGFVSMG